MACAAAMATRCRGSSPGALRGRGRADASAISIIPDEQEAIDAALRMGQPGDLLLVFADALVRTWKQIIRFKPEMQTSARSRCRNRSRIRAG
jgi:hypothetical protein